MVKNFTKGFFDGVLFFTGFFLINLKPESFYLMFMGYTMLVYGMAEYLYHAFVIPLRKGCDE